MNGCFIHLIGPLLPSEATLYRWPGHASIMICDGEPTHKTSGSASGHELFEVEEDSLWEVVQKRLEAAGESADDDSIEAHLEPIAQATAERFVRTYLAHDALLAYAKWEEEFDAWNALSNEGVPSHERALAYHALVSKWFPAIVKDFPLLSAEELIAEGYQGYTTDEQWMNNDSVWNAMGEASLALRHAALRACGEKVLVTVDGDALMRVEEPSTSEGSPK